MIHQRKNNTFTVQKLQIYQQEMLVSVELIIYQWFVESHKKKNYIAVFYLINE